MVRVIRSRLIVGLRDADAFLSRIEHLLLHIFIMRVWHRVGLMNRKDDPGYRWAGYAQAVTIATRREDESFPEPSAATNEDPGNHSGESRRKHD
jgi:hypothetical protein